MERALQPVLGAIGIDFYGKNYAMGGTGSGGEVSLCAASIFGKDNDFFTWDYGMTDGKSLDSIYWYAKRQASLSQLKPENNDGIPHRPALFALHHSRQIRGRLIPHLEDANLTVLAMHPESVNFLTFGFPDMINMSDAKAAELPRYVAYMRCGRGYEGGEPGCGKHKFNNTICPKRGNQQGWHPGYKYHAFQGNLLALTVMEITQQAIEELKKAEPQGGDASTEAAQTRLQALLDQLNAEEQAAYDYFHNSGILYPKNMMLLNGTVSFDEMFQYFPFCHIAKLPSEIRFKGLLTENFTATTTNPNLDRTWERGVSWTEIAEVEKNQNETFVDPIPERNKGPMLFLRGPPPCEEELELDSREGYFITTKSGWRTMTLPNDSEAAYYTEFDGNKALGLVLMCPVKCSWGNCAAEDISRFKENAFGGETPGSHLELEINGVPVVGSFRAYGGCFALRHGNADHRDSFVFKPNGAGRYEFKMRLTAGGNQPWAFLKISSTILI
jgi:hypothetical protein